MTTPLPSHLKTILLIDDDKEEFELFQVAVAEANLPVTLLYASECDTDKLKTFPKPDFIFLDINMPEFDGFYWLRGIREKVAEEIPIIMYSTTLNTQRVSLSYQLGANLFLSKPDSIIALGASLQKILDMDWSNPRQLAKESFAKEKFHLI